MPALVVAATAFAQDSGSKLPPGVIAQQGGAQITMQDIEAYAQKIPDADRVGFFDSPKRIQNVIMNLLLQKQLAAEARSQKLDQDPSVERQIAQSTDDTLARVDLAHYRDSLKVPDFSAISREYYQSHKDEFVQHGQVDVKHVLVTIKDRGIDAAKALIGEVEAQARAHPEQFDALVEKYSEDPSKNDNHGLIADAASGNTVAQFSAAAGALKKPGDVSPVVRTEYGFHVLQLVDRKPDRQLSYAEVSAKLIEKLRKDYIDKEVANHSDHMRNNPLEANPDLVASIRTHFLPPGATLPSEAADANSPEHKTQNEPAPAKSN